MRREDLEHIVKTAAEITGDTEIVVIGSQAILGQHPEAPESLFVSIEADVYSRNQPEKAIDMTSPVAKLAAGREQDLIFVDGALRSALVDLERLRRAVDLMPSSHRELVRSGLDAVLGRL